MTSTGTRQSIKAHWGGQIIEGEIIAHDRKSIRVMTKQGVLAILPEQVYSVKPQALEIESHTH